MRKNIRKTLSIMMIIMMTVVMMNFNWREVKAEVLEEKSTIWVIGDSTVSAFNDNYYYPRYGYGTQLQNYFNSNKYEVKNIALSGRSSKSYINDTEYKTLLDGMKDGDYLIIGFGHNDEKLEEARYTNPNGTYKDAGSFANSLYVNYIVPAEKVGCNVILCTPIVRRTATGIWEGTNLHITSTSGEYEGGDYPQAIRDLGSQLNIPVVDMTKMTKALYDELGANETINLHAWASSNSTSVDNTHTNIWGGTYNAYLLAKEVKELNIGSISEAVIEDKIASAPSKKDILVSNPDYKETEYNPILGESTLWQDIGIWKGTVFGNIGDNPNTFNFSLGTNEEGKMNISVKNNKGKIASTVDGLAMYYYKVSSSSKFTLTANATINSIDSNNQVSFGLMARDDMYIDTYTTATLGDYVAAAPLRIAEKNAWSCFARKSGVLTQGGTVKNTSINPGDTVELKIESNSDGYACTFGNEETITGGFDFPLTSIDSDYVYVGMFAARNADVTFDNIKLVVDGVEVTAGNITPETPDAEQPEVPDNNEDDNDNDNAIDDPEGSNDKQEEDNANETINGNGNVDNSANSTTNKSEANSDKNNLPITGGNSSIIVVVAALLIAGLGTLLAIKKKRTNI